MTGSSSCSPRRTERVGPGGRRTRGDLTAPPGASAQARLLGSGVVAVLFLNLGCAPPPSPKLRVERTTSGAETRLVLIPAPGVKINARLKPRLERPDSPSQTFDSPSLTQDSAYFTAPPNLAVTGDPAGVVRASVCLNGERVCRVLSLEVTR